VFLDGAHLASWIPDAPQDSPADDLLWTSPISDYGPSAAIRGGIPLVGPWFGPGRDGRSTPQHGWLRTSRWEFESAKEESDSVTLLLRLDDADPTGTGITARSRFVIAPDQISVAVRVSAGSEPLDLEVALHTYVTVGHVEQIALEGLADRDFLDNTAGLARRHQDGEPRIHGLVDRVYEQDGEVRIQDPVLGRTVRIEPEGSTRTVLWNPGATKAATMADIPDDGWPGFVCVETAACKDGAIHLEPSHSHTLGALLRLEETS
jgi:glucose-6-phosphate 1-epimerase